MPLKKYKPITAGTRWRIGNAYAEVTTSTPEKSLLETVKKTGGRNAQGHRSMRYIGGGNKKMYRIIDFKRNKHEVPAKVASIEYDPNRTAFIALLNYVDGEKRYILHPKNLSVGDNVVSGANSKIEIGNCLPLKNIPLGTFVHNIELIPNKGGQIVRSAGGSAKILAKQDNYVTLRLPSKEIRLIHKNCYATIGELGNSEALLLQSGKAGHKRWLGIRPTVRGSAMNACDHPHGGGEGRTPIGKSSPVTPWGKPTLGFKTRKTKRISSKYIIRQKL